MKMIILIFIFRFRFRFRFMFISTLLCALLSGLFLVNGQFLIESDGQLNHNDLIDYYPSGNQLINQLINLDDANQPNLEGQKVYYQTVSEADEADADADLLNGEKRSFFDEEEQQQPDDNNDNSGLEDSYSLFTGQDDRQQIKLAPINDPIEFKLEREPVKLKNETELFKTLISLYLDSETNLNLKQQQQQQQQEQEDDDQLVSARSSPQQLSESDSAVIERLLSLNNKLDQAEDENEDEPTLPSAASYGSSGGEYIDHPLALAGHQYVQGGAGEGRQLLGPDGSFENVQVVKSDRAVPSYCDPPNPCPIGFTAEDGCLERFVNSASFSREYQAKQKCSCDNEHSLFNCAAPQTTSGSPDNQANELVLPSEGSLEGASDEKLLDTLARTVSNRFGNLANIKSLINQEEDS